jgi:hypothetical protein
MSWGNCSNGSNNIHFDFPPIMEDGRNFAQWQPGAIINEKIRINSGIKTNNDYRQYLINNADQIILSNQREACQSCCSCTPKYGGNRNDVGNNSTPYLYKSCGDSNQPFGYENTDLKQYYLSSFDLNSRMVAPLITQDDILKYGMKNAK